MCAVLVCFLFFRGCERGMEASQLPGVRRGNGGESALELGVLLSSVSFWGGWRRVSAKGEGGKSASSV